MRMTDDATTADQRHVAFAHVRLALLSVSNAVLYAAISEGNSPRLPTAVPVQGEALDQIAQSQLSDLVGSERGYMEQLYTFSFDEPLRSEIVVSYLALTPGAPDLAQEWEWRPVAEVQAQLPRTDKVVLEYALVRLRAKIGYTTIAFHLMPQSFSLSDLQQTYESILGRELDPRNFRRRMVSSRLLKSENRLRREGSHRPAALYRFAGNHDPASYLTPGAAPVRASDQPDA